MRLLRTLAPLVLVASLSALLSACGSGSSSGPAADGGSTPPTTGGTGTVTSGGLLELRPVYARYATGVHLGPQVPQDVLTAMSSQSCPMKPQSLQGMVMECGPDKTVFLLQDSIVSGHVTQADVQEIGHKNLYFLRLTLDPTAAAALDSQAASMTGTGLAFCYGGSVLASIIVESPFSSAHLTITGNFDKAQATKLAGQITAS